MKMCNNFMIFGGSQCYNKVGDNMKDKRKKNIFLFFIYMIVIFIIVDLVNQVIPGKLGNLILYSKYGTYILVESLCILVVFCVMMLSNNNYVFTQKHEKFIKSIGVGAFMFAFSLFRALISTPWKHIELDNLLSLIIFCGTIGIFEEFLCRGWLLNEFIERFGHDRKHVLLSIILSSLIFGGMHVTNIWIGGQTVFETAIQIFQATAMGMMLGAIYYRTKNIWSVAFLHGFWDFAIFLEEVNRLRECTSLTPSTKVMIYTAVVSTIMVIVYICISLYILRPSKISPLIEGDTLTEEDKKKETKRNIILVLTMLVLYPLMGSIPVPKDYEDYTVCYTYKERYLGDIEYHQSSYDMNTIEEGEYSFEIEDTEDGIILINKNTEEKITLFEYSETITYHTIIYKNNDVYTINIFEKGKYYDGVSLYYSTFVTLNNLSNEYSYLEQIKESLKEYDLPDIDEIGYITRKNDSYRYPYGSSKQGYVAFIDKDNELYILTDDESKKAEEPEEVEPVIEEEVVEEPVEEQIEETE